LLAQYILLFQFVIQEAARKALPIIVPIHPALRRFGLSTSRRLENSDLPLDLSGEDVTGTVTIIILGFGRFEMVNE